MLLDLCCTTVCAMHTATQSTSQHAQISEHGRCRDGHPARAAPTHTPTPSLWTHDVHVRDWCSTLRPCLVINLPSSRYVVMQRCGRGPGCGGGSRAARGAVPPRTGRGTLSGWSPPAPPSGIARDRAAAAAAMLTGARTTTRQGGGCRGGGATTGEQEGTAVCASSGDGQLKTLSSGAAHGKYQRTPEPVVVPRLSDVCGEPHKVYRWGARRGLQRGHLLLQRRVAVGHVHEHRYSSWHHGRHHRWDYVVVVIPRGVRWLTAVRAHVVQELSPLLLVVLSATKLGCPEGDRDWRVIHYMWRGRGPGWGTVPIWAAGHGLPWGGGCRAGGEERG